MEGVIQARIWRIVLKSSRNVPSRSIFIPDIAPTPDREFDIWAPRGGAGEFFDNIDTKPDVQISDVGTSPEGDRRRPSGTSSSHPLELSGVTDGLVEQADFLSDVSAAGLPMEAD
jgi:hypothetical protein